MNYKESKLILAEIKKAKRILVNCHRGPDLDSIGSALAMKYVLKSLDKEVTVICPSEKLYPDLSFLKDYERISKNIDFNKYDFSNYDLLVTLDSSNWEMVTSDKSIPLVKLPIIVVDHHHTNTHYGMINLVDSKRSAVAEILYLLFNDWKIEIDKDIATALLTGILGDTGIFKFPNTSDKTFEIAYKLMKFGADKNLIIDNTFRNYDFKLIKFWGEVLNLAKLDKKYKFVYSFIPYEIYEKWGKQENAKEIATDLFAQSTKGTNFGFVGLEVEKNKLSLSFRSKMDFDTSIVAMELGGGGHKAASGAKITGLPFEEAVEKVLHVARKYAKKNT